MQSRKMAQTHSTADHPTTAGEMTRSVAELETLIEHLDPITKLTRDLRNAAITLSDAEARFLVDSYYAMQRDRIRSAHQTRQLTASQEPHDVTVWLSQQRFTLEKQVLRALDAYSEGQPPGVWARSIIGIGPVIAAGLLANIDITKAPTVGHIWRFAGLDPTTKWNKATKRPWNASLKRLCFLIGESFVKVSNMETDTYGKVYKARKEYEARKNEAGDYADQAAASLAAKKFGAETDARKHYEAGKLPPARLHLRAERYATKLFLAHFHHVMFETKYGRPPDRPYILSDGAHLAHPELAAHTHFIAPPNWPMAAVAAESTTEAGRAVEGESTVRSERAANSESTKVAERAGDAECTGKRKRAVGRESTAPIERAALPMPQGRARKASRAN